MADRRPQDRQVATARRLQECTAYYYPHAFINKAGEPIVIKGLDATWQDALIQMYLAFTPKRSFGGLPPADPDDCARWVHGMIGGGGINLVAMAFDQGVVGHAALFGGAGRSCELLAVVSPPKQNIGIGTELVRCSIHLAHALGFEHIWACIEAKNLRCRHVLKKCGFGCEAPDQADEVKMALNLREYHDPTRVQVREIMSREVLTVHKGWSCRDAAAIFLNNSAGSLPVVDDHDEVVGILSQTDLIVPGNIDKKVGEVRTRKTITVQESAPLAEIIHLFQTRKVWCIPVVDDKSRLVGVVTRRDILAYYAR
ncbi:MAG: GNAT family N-acetyltransferase [Planctomycetota bacterium]